MWSYEDGSCMIQKQKNFEYRQVILKSFMSWFFLKGQWKITISLLEIKDNLENFQIISWWYYEKIWFTTFDNIDALIPAFFHPIFFKMKIALSRRRVTRRRSFKICNANVAQNLHTDAHTHTPVLPPRRADSFLPPVDSYLSSIQIRSREFLYKNLVVRHFSPSLLMTLLKRVNSRKKCYVRF